MPCCVKALQACAAAAGQHLILAKDQIIRLGLAALSRCTNTLRSVTTVYDFLPSFGVSLAECGSARQSIHSWSGAMAAYQLKLAKVQRRRPIMGKGRGIAFSAYAISKLLFKRRVLVLTASRW